LRQLDRARESRREIAIAASSQSIDFQGVSGDSLGIALWQADGSGPEPAAVGHRFVTPIEAITAHYYVASRDYVDRTARGGLAATELHGAWPRLRAAFGESRTALGNLIVRLPLTTAGADREGEDWWYRDGVETRHLRPQAPLPLLLNDESVLEVAPPRLVLTEDYRGARSFADVRIALVSEPTPIMIIGSRASSVAAAVADALAADIGGRPVSFAVDVIRLTPETFGGCGRTSGRYADIPAARLEVIG
jgi:hypothetical protein